MKIQHGAFSFSYDKKEHDMGTQDSNIRPMPKKVEESQDVSSDKIVKGARLIIQTYFIWKMADRVVEKVLR